VSRFAPAVFDPDALRWELYYLPDDFSQARNVASEHPEKVKELSDLWWEEARKNNVLPLLAGMSAYFGIVPPMTAKTRWTFWGADVQNFPQGICPPINNRSYSITADLEIPDGGAEGVIVAAFDHLGGYSLFVDDGKLKHTYSFMGVETYRQESSEPLPMGAIEIKFDFEADAPVMAPGGTATLSVNDKVVGSGRMKHTVPILFTAYSGMDIGRDNGEVVDPAYEAKAPFAFTGTINRVIFDIRQPEQPHQQNLHEAETAQLQARHIEA
jgi:hypothetical protein